MSVMRQERVGKLQGSISKSCPLVWDIVGMGPFCSVPKLWCRHKKTLRWCEGLFLKVERVMRLTSLRSVYADEQVSSSGNLGYWIAAMHGTAAALRRALELRSHLITRHKKTLRWCEGLFLKVERVMRFELTTFSLATRCSTTELHPHRCVLVGACFWKLVRGS